MSDVVKPDLTTLTVDLLAAYVTNNSIPSEDLAKLIEATHAALAATLTGSSPTPEVQQYVPAVSVKKSLASRDYLVSMIDGKPYKTLKRHITSHGLTEAEYKERYKLPSNYPMVAPSYSDLRRAAAARIGLGRRPAPVASSPAPAVKEKSGGKARGGGAAKAAAPGSGEAPQKKAAPSPAAAKAERKGQRTSRSKEAARPSAPSVDKPRRGRPKLKIVAPDV
ncbi:MucR family transcriptional regulator [Sphingobium sp. AN641]|uniref:MucR family transcriptional regulator n=1 Tax=Sphingobium sp. AN641 TaxID=3133443 RepID=UPI0030BA363B